MKIIDHFNSAEETAYSFEIAPGPSGGSVTSLFNIVEALIRFNPLFISVANHSPQVPLAKEEPIPEALNLLICAEIAKKYNLNVVCHLLCNALSSSELKGLLPQLSEFGIGTAMALRGDRLPGSQPLGYDFIHASDLIREISSLKAKGGNLSHFNGGELEIGVAGYPETHPESPDSESDLFFLKEKVDAGGDFIVTQMFFSNDRYWDFVKNCRELGIKVPIIAGLMPIYKASQIAIFKDRFGVEIPAILSDQLFAAQTEEEGMRIGENWLMAQVLELLDKNIPLVHFYAFSLNGAEIIMNVLNKIKG